MPILSNLYQTVSDNGNPDAVEANGAILCTHNAWLGDGYYFWDNIIERARWWGTKHYGNSYMICKAYADIDDGKYLDLAGNTEQIGLFRKCYEDIQKRYGSSKEITVSFVISFMRKTNLFPFQAIRAISENCGGDMRVKFYTTKYTVRNTQKCAFLNLMPPIQICIYDKKSIKDYHIIYPQEYVNGVV